MVHPEQNTPARTIGIVAVILIAIRAYLKWRNVPPAPRIPTPVLPSPIGFDALHAAANLQVKTNDVCEAAFGKHGANGQEVYSLADKAALVAENEPALIAARAALRLDYMRSPDPKRDQVLDMRAFRSLCRLFVLDARVKAANGDFAAGVDSCIDAIELGITAPRGGNMIGFLSTIVCDTIGRRPIWPMIDELDSSAASAVAKRLESILARRVPFADTLRQEKWTGQKGLIDEFDHPVEFPRLNDPTAGSQYKFAIHVDNSEPADAEFHGVHKTPLARKLANYVENVAGYLCGRLFVHVVGKWRWVANYTATIDADIARAEQPWQVARDWPRVRPPLFAIEMSSVFQSVRFKDVQTRTDSGLLLCTLALQAYRAAHGEFPATLADLVTDRILDSVPEDPFAKSAGMPFAYRQSTPHRFHLYSVGPDGIDNHGIPVILTRSEDVSVEHLKETDTGDWVVGANVGIDLLPR